MSPWVKRYNIKSSGIAPFCYWLFSNKTYAICNKRICECSDYFFPDWNPRKFPENVHTAPAFFNASSRTCQRLSSPRKLNQSRLQQLRLIWLYEKLPGLCPLGSKSHHSWCKYILKSELSRDGVLVYCLQIKLELEILDFVLGGKPENTEKNPLSQAENQ